MAVVLIVEDEVPLRVLAESIIQERGHTTLSASTVEQALALFEGDQTVELKPGIRGPIRPDVRFTPRPIKIRAHVSQR
jgi:CheY-like chemotaxis protein